MLFRSRDSVRKILSGLAPTDESENRIFGMKKGLEFMQLPDSTYLGATISAADGTFVLEPEPEDYQLIVQHLLYQTRQVKGQARDAGVITLESKDYNLEEVVIEGERPFVTVEQGKLNYDISAISEKHIVNNAYEAICKLPGVQDRNGKLSLVGAKDVTVILNGKEIGRAHV